VSRRIMFIFPAYGSDYELARLPSWQGCRTPPLGLLAITSYLDSRGQATRLLDIRELVVRHRTVDVLPLVSREVDSFSPDVIGVPILTAHFEDVRRLLKHLKNRHPNIHLLAGGAHPSVEPELTLAQIEELDSACIGAGEEVCLDISQGNTLKDIPGLMLRGSEEAFQSRRMETDLDNYPFPYQGIDNLDFYTGYSAYALPNWLCKSLIAVTARGCPFSCRFCASEWSRPYRRHSVEYVVEMVRFLARLGIDTLHIRDETLAADRTRLETLCEEFRRSGLFLPNGQLRWRCLMRADQVTPELLASMKASGCFAIGIGMESGTDRVLEFINKKTTVEQNAQAARYVMEAGMDLQANFIVGFPTETEEEMLQTIRFMSGLDINSRVCFGFRPMPGSPFYWELVQSGILKRDPTSWQNLGEITEVPNQSFAEVSVEGLREITKLAHEKSFGIQYVKVFEDVAKRQPGLVREVARRVGAQIVPLPGTGGEPRFIGIQKDSVSSRFAGKARNALNRFPRTKAILRKLIGRGQSTVRKAT
jgi:anaerobic magnesium-protoporphyrin IX monomethyl ester cyclase